MPLVIHVIIGSFNRCDQTLACLSGLRNQIGLDNKVVLRTTLVDASSSDGTVEAVQREFPETEILCVPSTKFWAESMAVGCDAVMPQQPDFVLFLNDDVSLRTNAISSALDAPSAADTVIVGATTDAWGQTTYSGMRRLSWRPTNLIKLRTNGQFQAVDTFNCNFVLVPRRAYTTLGGLDGRFGHALADLDYGLRAREKAIPVLLAPEPIGVCESNPMESTWRDASLARSARLRALRSAKGAPFPPLLRYTVRHTGLTRGLLLATGMRIKALTLILRRK